MHKVLKADKMHVPEGAYLRKRPNRAGTAKNACTASEFEAGSAFMCYNILMVHRCGTVQPPGLSEDLAEVGRSDSVKGSR
jgi:hypothetical protein